MKRVVMFFPTMQWQDYFQNTHDTVQTSVYPRKSLYEFTEQETIFFRPQDKTIFIFRTQTNQIGNNIPQFSNTPKRPNYMAYFPLALAYF